MRLQLPDEQRLLKIPVIIRLTSYWWKSDFSHIIGHNIPYPSACDKDYELLIWLIQF